MFRRRKESASDVKDYYDTEIKQFLHKVNASGSSWWPDGDLLGRLFDWGDSLLNERDKLQRDLSGAEGKFRVEWNRQQSQFSVTEGKYRAERTRLQSQLAEAEERTKADRKRFQTQFTEAQERSTTIQNSLKSELSQAEARIRELEAQLAIAQRKIIRIENENESRKAQHREELDNMKSKYTTVTKKEKDIHGREVKKLVGQLLVNQDDNLGWTDDKLKFKFQQLQNLINSLVSPHNKEYRIPPDSQVDHILDPTGFLAHATKSKAYFLLQSTIWTILYEQFFSIPFGFGVLGEGEARKKLLDMFVSWAKLLGKSSSEGMHS